MKTVTREVVDRFARALITLNGSTTTLDVKFALRDRGYYVKQEDVREYMLDITSNDGDIAYTDNGRHRIYSFKETDDNPILLGTVNVPFSQIVSGISAQPASVTTTHSTAAAVTYISPPRRVRHNNDNVPADYFVMDENGNDKARFSNVTRGQAKYLWASSTGRSYYDARTIRI